MEVILGTRLVGPCQYLRGFLFCISPQDIASSLKNCTKTFSKCRKYEDEAITIISACSTNPTELKLKVKHCTGVENITFCVLLFFFPEGGGEGDRCLVNIESLVKVQLRYQNETRHKIRVSSNSDTG